MSIRFVHFPEIALVAWLGMATTPALGVARPNQSIDGEQDGLTRLAVRLAAVEPKNTTTIRTSPGNAGTTPVSTPVAEQSSTPAPDKPDAIDSENRPLPLPSKLGRSVSADKDEVSGFGWMWKTTAALGAVIGLILLLRAVLSRLTGQPSATGRSPVVEVLSRVAVAPRSHVLLVRLGRRILAVGESSAGLRTLAQIDDPEEFADLLQATTSSGPNSATRGFGQLLRRFNSTYRDEDCAEDEDSNDSEYSIDHARDRVSNVMARVRALGAEEKSP